jgi:amino acid adenylation domain-containing protein
MAAFDVLLWRYSGQEDLLVGMPVANRGRTELEGLIGLFVNTLVLRNDLSGNPTVRELLVRVRERCLDVYAHQELPLEKLVEDLKPARDQSRNPLFQVMLLVQNASEEHFVVPGIMVTTSEPDRGATQVDLTLYIRETPEGLKGAFGYATDLFDQTTIERMAGHFCTLLEAMVAAPERRLSELPLLAESERQQLLVAWNDTARNYGDQARLHRLLEKQAALTLDSFALEFDGKKLTYVEVNHRANQLARLLRQKGVGPDVLVGVFAERSFEMVLSLLAVLKAGGAYVPLDPSYPAERLAHMIEDARASLVLAQPHLANQLPKAAKEVHLLDATWKSYRDESGDDLDDIGTPENLAYVIFTSGSTGRPKGAMNEHRGICNRLMWMQEEYGLTDKDRVLQKTPYSFDVSVWEFFWPLLTGARLVIARPEGHRDSPYLVKLICDSGITTLHFVPSMLRLFLEEEGLEALTSLRRVFCSGEALPHELQERFFARLPDVELHNLYGPTEAAVDVTYWACRRGDERLTVPIGRPVANTQIYVLDNRMEPVPVGVAGELYIGGVQVGRGYAGRDDLTAERFVPDPFSSTSGARLYKTGDLARYLPDGAIEYLGRIDHQVKMRGQRIELGEIEATLDQYADVAQSVVTMREDKPGDQHLVAYVVPRRADLSAKELKEHLSKQLPSYMVPSVFVFLEVLPLTSSGKIDRKRLPAPEQSDIQQVTYVAPRTQTEKVLAGIWAEVLGLEQVGIEDNFFDLGGHSLLAMRMVSRVLQEFSVELPLRELFAAPTIAGLSLRIEAPRARGASVLRKERIEL